MTNGWVDIKNTDMMLIMGGNPAENHPCGFKCAVEAKRQRNAKMIVVDPRFTRTAALADLFVQLRAGSDIAFLGGLIRYAIENNRIAREYLLHYTNAAFLVKEGFKLPEDGLFSGYDAAAHAYDKATWNYEGAGGGKPESTAALPAAPAYDLTLEHPRSVFQLLKRHHSRYTPEMVERITGVPKVEFLKVADLFTSIRKDGDMKKAGTIIYAVGWTQHSSGTQTIRGAAILQLLLGNVGRAGGSVNALAQPLQHSGLTDMAGIFDLLPGYLGVPTPPTRTSKAYVERITPQPSSPARGSRSTTWSNTPEFAVSLEEPSTAMPPPKATTGPCTYLPVDRQYSWAEIWDDMYRGKVKGLLAFGAERRVHRSEFPQEHRGAEEGGVAGGVRDLSGRDQRVLEISWHHKRGDGEDPDHGIPPAGRGLCGKGRNVCQLGALAAVEGRSPAPAARLQARPGNPGAHFPQRARTVSKGRR
jgi:formate dehydrogenase major subunit